LLYYGIELQFIYVCTDVYSTLTQLLYLIVC